MELGAQELANIANGAAHSGKDKWPKKIFAALATTADRRMGDFNPQALANTAWAFAKAGQNDISVFAAFRKAL